MEGLQNSPWGALEVVSEETHLAMWPRIETRLMRTRLDRALPCSSVVAGAGKELASPSVRKQPTSDSPLRRELPREVAQCGLNFLVALWPIVWPIPDGRLALGGSRVRTSLGPLFAFSALTPFR